MNKAKGVWLKRALFFMGFIFVFLLCINLLLTYTLSYFLGSQIIPKINNDQRQLTLIASVSIFPSATITINDLHYYLDKKDLFTVGKIAIHVDFWKLFKGKLYIDKISINQARINFYNIPPLAWKKSVKTVSDIKKQGSEPSTQKNTQQSSAENSFFKLTTIEFNELSLYYSAPPMNPPVYLNSITYHYIEPSEHSLLVNGKWKENPLLAKVMVNFFSTYPVIKIDINFTNNTLNLTAQPRDSSYQLQTDILIKNPPLLAHLFSLKPDELPLQIHSFFTLRDNKLTMSSFEALYPTTQLNANIGPNASGSYMIKVSLSEDLLLKFYGKAVFSQCPLPKLVKTLIKSINTQIKVNSLETSQKSSLISIDGVGIHFTGDILTEVVQKNLQTCFDYKLEDESTQTIYTIN